MICRAIFLLVLLSAPLIARADSSGPRVLQDPKTKVIFYLESDECHIAAISPEGKLLWCTQVMPTDFKKRGDRFGGFDFWHPGNFPSLDPSTKSEDCIVVFSFMGTTMTSLISKKTGKEVGAIGE